MARAALKWSREDLAEAADVAAMTIARLEDGQVVSPVTRTKVRLAFEKKRVRFVDDGPFKGAVVGPIRPGGSLKLEKP